MQQFITLSPEQFNQFMANPPQMSLPPTTSIALGFNQTPTLIDGRNTYAMQGDLNDMLFSAGVSPFAFPRIQQMQAAVIPPVFYAPLPGAGGMATTPFAQGNSMFNTPQQPMPVQGFGASQFIA
jgi:hypothetical protein